MVRWRRSAPTRNGPVESQRALRTTSAAGSSAWSRADAAARAASISVSWPRCWSTTSVGRCGTSRARWVSMAGSVMPDLEFPGRPRRRALVAGPDRHAALARRGQDLARQGKHDALLDQAELLDLVAVEAAQPVHARLDHLFGRRGAGGHADVALRGGPGVRGPVAQPPRLPGRAV